MKVKNMNKKHYLLIGIILLVAVFTLFLSIDKASSPGSSVSDYGVPTLAKPVTNGYFAETGWRDVSDWEIEQCTKGLTSEIEGKLEVPNGFNVDDIVPGTAVTLQALKEEYYNSYYYELAWYVQPQQDITVAVVFYNEKDTSIKYDVTEPLEIKAYQGKGYYTAWEDTQNYTKAQINFGDKSMIIDVINKYE